MLFRYFPDENEIEPLFASGRISVLSSLETLAGIDWVDFANVCLAARKEVGTSSFGMAELVGRLSPSFDPADLRLLESVLLLPDFVDILDPEPIQPSSILANAKQIERVKEVLVRYLPDVREQPRAVARIPAFLGAGAFSDVSDKLSVHDIVLFYPLLKVLKACCAHEGLRRFFCEDASWYVDVNQLDKAIFLLEEITGPPWHVSPDNRDFVARVCSDLVGCLEFYNQCEYYDDAPILGTMSLWDVVGFLDAALSGLTDGESDSVVIEERFDGSSYEMVRLIPMSEILGYETNEDHFGRSFVEPRAAQSEDGGRELIIHAVFRYPETYEVDSVSGLISLLLMLCVRCGANVAVCEKCRRLFLREKDSIRFCSRVNAAEGRSCMSLYRKENRKSHDMAEMVNDNNRNLRKRIRDWGRRPSSAERDDYLAYLKAMDTYLNRECERYRKEEYPHKIIKEWWRLHTELYKARFEKLVSKVRNAQGAQDGQHIIYEIVKKPNFETSGEYEIKPRKFDWKKFREHSGKLSEDLFLECAGFRER